MNVTNNNMRLKYTLILAILILSFLACNKTKISELPTWNSDWLLPIAKGNVSFETLKALSKTKTSIKIPSLDLGYQSGVNVNIPPLSINQMGPYKIPLSDWIHKVHFDSLEIFLSFSNLFPIEISSGTQFSFRKANDTNDPSNIIYQHTVNRDIKPNDYYFFDITTYDNFMMDTVYVFLENFKSPGANNITFLAQPLSIDIEVKIIDIKTVELYSNKKTISSDTVNIDFSNEDTPSDTSNYGKVNLFIDNGLPIQFGIQIYFLEKNTNQIIDSLMSPAFDIDACSTDANGNPVNVVSKKSSFMVSTQRIDRIKKASRAVLFHNINTYSAPPPYAIINDNSYLKLQITGDLHLSFNLNNL